MKTDERMEVLLESGNIIEGHVYQDGKRHDMCFEGTPENIASFIARHPYAESILLLDELSLPVMDTFGWFINKCEDKELLERVKEHLIPMQMGEAEPKEFFCPTAQETYAYSRQKDAGLTMC